jgi:serine beta-lactamase-like protein LACTB, mitochondrial
MKKKIALAILFGIAAPATAWFIVEGTQWYDIGALDNFASQGYGGPFQAPGEAAGQMLRDARQRLGLVGLSAAVSIDGQVVWAGAAGSAGIGEESRSLSPETAFRIGSTSKAITATLLARLVDRGVIDLDAPISTYMPELPNADWGRLTPRQLGSHTAGFPEYAENRDLWGLYHSLDLQRHFADVNEGLEIFDDTSLLSEPGEKFHYTSFDVNLLAAVMQSAAHKPYLDLMKEEVLTPLHMESTGGDHAYAHPDRIATFYQVRGKLAKRWRDVDLSQKWASGGLVATSSDLARLCGGWFDAHYLSPETVAKFWEPQRLKSGEINEQGYAIGWRARPESKEISPDRPTPRYHHGGVSKGAMSWLVCYPEARMGVALNINSLLGEFTQLSEVEPPISRLFFDLARSGIAIPRQDPPAAP